MGDSVEVKEEQKLDKNADKKAVKKSDKKAKPSFFKGVKTEFKKISWPDRQATLKQSVAVVAISVVVGIIIAVLDYVIQYGVNFLTTI